MMLKAATLAIVLSLSWPVAQAAGCVEEDAEITLTGTITRETFPGPPNYESIANGDRAETYWILESFKPIAICGTDAKKADSDSASRPRRIQLVVLDEQRYKLYAPLLSGRVSVSGKVFPRHTGHHHTETLIIVADMRAAPDT